MSSEKIKCIFYTGIKWSKYQVVCLPCFSFLFIGKCCWSIFWLILRERNVNHDLWISDFKGFLRSIQQTYYIKGFQLDNLTIYTYPPVIPWGERVQNKYRKKCKLAYRIQYDTQQSFFNFKSCESMVSAKPYLFYRRQSLDALSGSLKMPQTWIHGQP